MSEYHFKINGKDYQVCINGINGNQADVSVNGVAYQVELDRDATPQAAVTTASAPAPQAPASAPAAQEGASAPAKASAAAPQTVAAPAGGTVVTTPLPGVIIEVSVQAGQVVKRGQKVAVLEAMKMENDILASCDGTITAVQVHKGDSILEGAAVVTIG